MADMGRDFFTDYCRITHSTYNYDPLDDNNDNTEDEEVCIYEGRCKSRPFMQVMRYGFVAKAIRKMTIPMGRSEWKRLGVAPRIGDRLFVDKSITFEWGCIQDFQPEEEETEIQYSVGTY